jgi:hypothetical protein
MRKPDKEIIGSVMIVFAVMATLMMTSLPTRAQDDGAVPAKSK